MTRRINQSLIWDHFQTEGVASFQNSGARMRALAARLQRGQRVLNIGVGAGFLESFAVARGVDVHALDPSKAAIEGLQNRLQLAERAVVAGADSIPFQSKYFDVVVMSEVLEHLDDDTLHRALTEIQRILRPDGKLLITVPYAEVLSQGEAVCPCCGQRFHRWGHLRSFTRESLATTLRGHGFQCTKLSLEAFPDWRRSGLLNFAKSLSRFVMAKLGMGIAQPCIYAEATVTKS